MLTKRKDYFKRSAHLLQCLEAERREELQQQYNRPQLQAGDVLQIHYVHPQYESQGLKFKAVCVGVRNKGPRTSFVMYRAVMGQMIEYDMPLYSPFLKDIQVIGHIQRNTKRGGPKNPLKMYYLKDDGAKRKRWFMDPRPHPDFPMKELNDR